MNELVIISGKGGTGKTSITGALAQLFDNKILVDCDVDAADLHLLLTPEIQTKEDFFGGSIAQINHSECIQCNQCIEHCKFDAISKDYSIDPIFCEGCGVCFNICPANAINFDKNKNGECYLSKTAHGPMLHAKMTVGAENSGKLVSHLRMKAKSFAHKNNLNLILIDGPPGIGCPVIASLSSTNYCLIVSEPSLSALHDLKRVIELCNRFDIKPFVCINKYDIFEENALQIETYCNKSDIKVIAKIPYDINFTTAQLEGKSIVEFPNSKGFKEVNNLFKTLYSIIERQN